MTGTASLVTRDRLARSDGTVEQPVWFPRDQEMLFGIWNQPAQGLLSREVLICIHNGGYNMTSHHNQMWTRLCRDVARRGMHAFRFDLTGTGDSTGTDVRDPYGQAADDLLAAVEWLASQGLHHVALLGTCRGAMVSLGAASRVGGLKGVFLCAPAIAILSPDHRGLEPWQAPTLRKAVTEAVSTSVLRRLVRDGAYRRFVVDRARRRLSRVVRQAAGRPLTGGVTELWGWDDPMAPLRWLVGHEIPVKIYLGRQDAHFRQLEEVRAGTLGRLIDESPTVELEVVEGSVHRFISIDGQERFLAAAERWSREILLGS